MYTAGARVEGPHLVTPVGACPDVACLKCGTTNGIFPAIEDFEWLPTWAKVVTFFLRGPLARMIREAARVRVTMSVPLCDACQKIWASTKTLEWVLPIACFAGFFLTAVGVGQLANALDVPALRAVGVLVGLAVLFATIPLQGALVFKKRVVPARIKDGWIWFEHVHPSALATYAQRGR